MFDLQLTICERFNMSPFQIRRERLHEFCLLVRRLKKHEKQQEKKQVTKDGREKVFIRVTDYDPKRFRGGEK